MVLPTTEHDSFVDNRGGLSMLLNKRSIKGALKVKLPGAFASLDTARLRPFTAQTRELSVYGLGS